jgi:hypothetical protein
MCPQRIIEHMEKRISLQGISTTMTGFSVVALLVPLMLSGCNLKDLRNFKSYEGFIYIKPDGGLGWVSRTTYYEDRNSEENKEEDEYGMIPDEPVEAGDEEDADR